MSNKKTKKKGKTLSLTDFLNTADDSPKSNSFNWADETDFSQINNSSSYQSGVPKQKVIKLPTAPRAALQTDSDIWSHIPNDGPHTAFLGNLHQSYNEEKVANLFPDLKINHVRLPREKDGPLRGFGYVEFGDRESLIAGLKMKDSLQQTGVRIDIASNRNRDDGQDSFRRNRSNFSSMSEISEVNWRDRSHEPSRSFSNSYNDFDSRRSGYDDRRRPGGYNRGPRDDYRRDDYRRDDYRRDDYRRDDYRRDDFEQRDRGSYGRQWSHDNGSRRPAYDFNRQSNRHFQGGYQRFNDYPDQTDRFRKDDGPRERPALKLQPRQKPVEGTTEAPRSSSIFGNATPVDTSERDRAIDEKLIEQQKKVVVTDAVEEKSVEKPRKKSTNIFGAAKPVDTSAREKEIEAKIQNQLSNIKIEKREKEPFYNDPKPRKSSSSSSQLEAEEAKKQQKANEVAKPEYKLAPTPSRNAWANATPKIVPDQAPESDNSSRGEREEAEGGLKDSNEVFERTPEGAAENQNRVSTQGDNYQRKEKMYPRRDGNQRWDKKPRQSAGYRNDDNRRVGHFSNQRRRGDGDGSIDDSFQRPPRQNQHRYSNNREIHDRRRDKNFDNKNSGIKKQRPARKPGLTSGQTDKDSAPDFVRSSKFAVLECDHSEDEIQDTPPQSNSVTGEE